MLVAGDIGSYYAVRVGLSTIMPGQVLWAMAIRAGGLANERQAGSLCSLRRAVEELLKQASNNDEQAEARAYLGYYLSLSGKTDAAVPHLRWVKEYGNRNFVEYPLAVLELHRIEEAKARSIK